MHLKKIKLILFFFFNIIHGITFAQSPENMIGKPYTNSEVANFLKPYQKSKPVESFLPYLRLYKIDYKENGFGLAFNTDISLYMVTLFDSGYSYQKYTGSMPFNIQWGMNIDQIQEKSGGLDFVSENPFQRRMNTDDFQIDFYFENGKLYHLKITATLKTLQENRESIIAATGIRLVPDGQKINGNTVDGVGSMMWGEGTAKYQGEWSYGVPHGKGQYIDSFGNKYEGEFKLGFFWGQGEFYSKIYQYSYSGSFAMSKKHGKGRIGYSNKTTYLGDWQQDKMHGQGTYTIKDRYSYTGILVNNSFSGRGTLTTPDGIIDGYFKNGKPHGVCTQATKDGLQSIKGHFENGKKNGVFDVTIMGNKSTIQYQDDIEIKTGPIDPNLINKQ